MRRKGAAAKEFSDFVENFLKSYVWSRESICSSSIVCFGLERKL